MPYFRLKSNGRMASFSIYLQPAKPKNLPWAGRRGVCSAAAGLCGSVSLTTNSLETLIGACRTLSSRCCSLVLLYTTLRLKKSRGGSRQLDGLALDNTQLWLVGFYEVQYPLVLVCKVKFYFNSFFLINANLFYQGNNNTAPQMVDILILQKCLQVRVSGSDTVWYKGLFLFSIL